MKILSIVFGTCLGFIGGLFEYLAFFEKDIKGKDGLICFLSGIGCLSLGVIILLLIELILTIKAKYNG